MMGKHIVFATTGSLGDLHPFLAVGQALQEKGHRIVVATTKAHQKTVEKAGLEFAHMCPDPEPTAEFHAKFMDTRNSAKFVFSKYLSPAIENSYHDLLSAVEGADLLISQSLALAAPLVAAKTHIPWVSAVFQPMTLFSIYDPPVLPFLPFLKSKNSFAVKFNNKILKYARNFTQSWISDVTYFKNRLGIKDDRHPIYEGQHSPLAVLAMFSPLFGTSQPDWPVNTIQTGTALFGQYTELPDTLKLFLDNGDAPLVFTLGSASSNDPGDFYLESLDIAQALNKRAVLMTAGLSSQQVLPDPLPEWAMRVDYAPYRPIFEKACAVIHSGGIAASMIAIKAGVPQILVPFAHDQIDNSVRLEKLGVGKVVKRHKYKAKHIVPRFDNAFNDLQRKAKEIAIPATAENGINAACAEIERILSHGL